MLRRLTGTPNSLETTLHAIGSFQPYPFPRILHCKNPTHDEGRECFVPELLQRPSFLDTRLKTLTTLFQTNPQIPTTVKICRISRMFLVLIGVVTYAVLASGMGGNRPVVKYSSISASFLYHSSRSQRSNFSASSRGMSAIRKRRQ